MRTKFRFLGYFLFLLLLLIGALKVGVVPDADAVILYELRLPRILLAAAVGIGLSVSGAALQAVFGNPLCEPYLLGISSGATLGVLVASWLGKSEGPWIAPAFLGACCFALVLSRISKVLSQSSLLLAGIMLGSFGSSVAALVLSLKDPNQSLTLLSWLFGDFSHARLRESFGCLGGTLALSGLIWREHRALDLLLLGEEKARCLGLDVLVVRRRVILLSSLLVGLCVSFAGMIGFVGLVVPHFTRRKMGALHSILLPFCAMGGAAFLVVSDALARSAVPPTELPVGVVTAFLGAPLFLILLFKREAR